MFTVLLHLDRVQRQSPDSFHQSSARPVSRNRHRHFKLGHFELGHFELGLLAEVEQPCDNQHHLEIWNEIKSWRTGYLDDKQHFLKYTLALLFWCNSFQTKTSVFKHLKSSAISKSQRVKRCTEFYPCNTGWNLTLKKLM